MKHHTKYGRLVLACDSKNLWRKAVFPYYKAHRKSDREKLTHIDWPSVFKVFDSLKQEILDYTPWILIEVDGAEGDDIIATLATRYQGQPNILVSTDKDFKQLQAYTDVKQYDPDSNSMVTVDSGLKYLQEHIIRGDRGDGVPNILSDDNTFIVEGKRQKRMTQPKFEYFMAHMVTEFDDERARINWHRNKQLIDLRECPEHIQDDIIESFEEQLNMSKTARFFDYFVKYGLVNLMDNLADFKVAA